MIADMSLTDMDVLIKHLEKRRDEADIKDRVKIIELIAQIIKYRNDLIDLALEEFEKFGG